MQLVLELLKKIFVALQGVYTKQEVYTKAEVDSALAVRDTSIATNTESLDYIKARAASIPGGACVMFVDIPEDDGANEYWGDDAVNFARVYEIVLPKVGTGDGSAFVDWGDGTSDTISQTKADYVRHKYLSPGRYWIILSGNVKELTASGWGGVQDAQLASSYAAGIGIVSVELDSVECLKAPFSCFKSLKHLRARFLNMVDYSYYFFARLEGVETAEVEIISNESVIAPLMYCPYLKSAKVRVLNNGKNVEAFAYARPLQDFTFEWDGESLPYIMYRSADSKSLRRLTLIAPNLKNIADKTQISGKTNLTYFGAGLPSLVNGDGLFENTNLDKPSVLRLLNALPDRTGVEPEQEGDGVITFTSIIATAAINNIDADIQAAIDAAEAKGWTVEV